MSSINYKEAGRQDVASIIEFQLAMALETEELELDREILTRGVQALFADHALGRYYVAETNGGVIASLMVTYEWSDWRNGMVWWVQSVYVRPEFRRRGIYAGLYEHVKGFVSADPAVAGIRLYVDRRNAAAQEVYRRLGMNGEHYQVFEWMKS